MKVHIGPLQALARDLVGDCKRPNFYFVSDGPTVVTVTKNAKLARAHWEELARRRPLKECTLENRLCGVIASVQRESDAPGARLVVIA
jgi:hypothetical protein